MGTVPMLHTWLTNHQQLQEAFHPAAHRAVGSEAWRSYVEYNALAVITELGEFLDEIEIRPWHDFCGIADRTAAIEELVDVMHFVANLFVALDVSSDELNAAYADKLRENFKRLERGRSIPTAGTH